MDAKNASGHSLDEENSCSFTTLGIVDFLEADSRATFALHVDPKWLSARRLRPVLSNTALRDHGALIDQLFNLDLESSAELYTFVCWIHNPERARGPTHRYANVEWHRTAIGHSWLVIGATHIVEPANADVGTRSIAPVLQRSPSESFDWTQTVVPVQCPEYVHRLREIDWASTTVGSMSTWPDELRLLFNLMMRTDVPQAMYWGAELTVIYNQGQAYAHRRPIDTDISQRSFP